MTHTPAAIIDADNITIQLRRSITLAFGEHRINIDRYDDNTLVIAFSAEDAKKHHFSSERCEGGSYPLTYLIFDKPL